MTRLLSCHRLRSRAEEARLKATAAKSYYEELANWWQGLTRSINEICKNVREVRADISVSMLSSLQYLVNSCVWPDQSNSLRERERIEAQRRDGGEPGGE